MIKRLTCIIAVIIISQMPWSNGQEIKDWTYKYEGDKLPNKAGFAKRGKFVIAENSKEGILHISSIDSNKGAFYYFYVRKQDKVFLNSDTGYTIEFKAKLIKTDSKKYSSSIHIGAEDGRKDVKKFWGINLYTGNDSNYIVLTGISNITPIAIGEDFHTYRITVKDDQVTLYIDGTLACSVKVSKRISTNQLRFGDLTGKADGDWKLDYLRIYTQGAVAPAK